ncbi:MAG: hypothetical protein J5985_07265 [Kiritimatiellae bacterium]|nr:hypothetical protein [Kiritimatiellia bacterium]
MKLRDNITFGTLSAVFLFAVAGCVGTKPKNGIDTAAEKPLRVAVFVDSGARNSGVFRWLEITARAKGVVATPIDGAAVRDGALDAADVLVMPGGSSVTEAKSLGPEGREKVKEFVRRGGGYVGTCAGCCLLMEPARHHPDMLHMIPFKFGPSGGKADISVMFNQSATELAGIKKGWHLIRYSEGPVPLPSSPVKEADVKVIATYNGDINTSGGKKRPSMAGQAAAIAGTYGKGRLFVLSVHPESDEDDHYILKGAFRYLTGRNLEWDFPQRKRGQLSVGFMCDDSFGVETAKLVQRLVTEEEFDIVPLNKAMIEDGLLRRVDAVLAPDGTGSAKPETGLYAGNAGRTKAFLARGGRIFAWGSAAQTAKRLENGVTCMADSKAALAALRAFAKEPVPADALNRVPLAKVEKPIRAGIYQDESNSCIPIARVLTLSPEYDLRFLSPEDYRNGGLEGIDLLIQPGGGCTSQYKALGPKGVEALRNYVVNGGKYYGVCAGAFLALQQSLPHRPRLGLVPFKGDDPAYYRGDAPIKVALTQEGMEVFGTTNKNRTVIYYGGPAVVPGTPVADADVKVLAEYAGRIINTKQPKPIEEMAGKGAFIGGRVGKGKVFLSCPHPEKQECTFDMVKSGIKFLTGVSPSSPPSLDRVRGAVSVRYHSSDKASAQFLFDTLSRDPRIDVWPGKEWNDMAHIDVYVKTDAVRNADLPVLNAYIARGGRVVVVADTPAERKAAEKLKGAVVLESYDRVIEAILK